MGDLSIDLKIVLIWILHKLGVMLSMEIYCHTTFLSTWLIISPETWLFLDHMNKFNSDETSCPVKLDYSLPAYDVSSVDNFSPAF